MGEEQREAELGDNTCFTERERKKGREDERSKLVYRYHTRYI